LTAEVTEVKTLDIQQCSYKSHIAHQQYVYNEAGTAYTSGAPAFNNINKISTSNKINGSKDEQNIYNM
jgi:hypothetical protein